MRIQPCTDCWSLTGVVMGTAIAMAYITNAFNEVVHAGTQKFMSESLATIKDLVGTAPEPIGAAQFVRETTIAPGDEIVIVVGPVDETTGERPTSTIRAGVCPGGAIEEPQARAQRPLPLSRERTATLEPFSPGVLSGDRAIVPYRDDSSLDVDVLESILSPVNDALRPEPSGDVFGMPNLPMLDDRVPVDVARRLVAVPPTAPVPLPGSLGLLVSAGIVGAWLKWLA